MSVAAPSLSTSRVAAAGALASRLWRPAVMVPLAFLVTAAWFGWQAGHVNSYKWLIDELQYVRNGMSYADLKGPLPYVFGQPFGVPNVLFPLLMAPFFAVFDTVTAFHAIHVLQGILWASTLVPVYLLARRLGAAWTWALLAGLLSVWGPFGISTALLMTETTAYAVFPWALLAMTVAIADPRPKTDLLALLAIGLCAAARTQQGFLLLVFVVAIFAFELSTRDDVRLRTRLRRHGALWIALVLLPLGVLLAKAAGADILGGYGTTAGVERFPANLWSAAVGHAGPVFVSLGLVPAILFAVWLLRSLTDPLDRAERAFGIVAALTLTVLFYIAATFQLTIGYNPQERYVAYAIPVIVVGAIALLADRQRPAPRIAVLVSALVVALVVAGNAYPIEYTDDAFHMVRSPGSSNNDVLWERVPGLWAWLPGRALTAAEGLFLLTLVAGAVTLAALHLRRRILVPALMLACLAWGVAEIRHIYPQGILSIAGLYPKQVTNADLQPRDWIDRAADGRSVTLMTGWLDVPGNSVEQWQWHQFWNKDIDNALITAFTNFPARKYAVDPSTGRLSNTGDVDLVVASPVDPALGLRGRVVRTSTDGAVLMEPERPLRAAWRTTGLQFGGPPVAPERPITIDTFPRDTTPAGRAVTLTIIADGATAIDPNLKVPVTIDDANGRRVVRLAQGERRDVRVTAQKVAGTERATLRVGLGATRVADGGLRFSRLLALRPAS